MKANDLPVNRWVLGCIMRIIQGPDNKIRVVKICTVKGIIKRRISNVAALPQEEIQVT